VDSSPPVAARHSGPHPRRRGERWQPPRGLWPPTHPNTHTKINVHQNYYKYTPTHRSRPRRRCSPRSPSWSASSTSGGRGRKMVQEGEASGRAGRAWCAALTISDAPDVFGSARARARWHFPSTLPKPHIGAQLSERTAPLPWRGVETILAFGCGCTMSQGHTMPHSNRAPLTRVRRARWRRRPLRRQWSSRSATVTAARGRCSSSTSRGARPRSLHAAMVPGAASLCLHAVLHVCGDLMQY
jgi:hypothetical protein